MLVMHFGHRVPEMHSHDATSYYAAIRPASAASHPYAVRHRSHNDFTPGCVACFARPTPGYRGLLDLAFGSPCLVACYEKDPKRLLCEFLSPIQWLAANLPSRVSTRKVRSVAMLVMHFGHRDPEMHSHQECRYARD